MELALQIPYSEEKIELVERLGLKAIQLRIGPGFPIETGDPKFGEARRAADDLKRRGIQVVALGFYRNHLDPDQELRQEDNRRLRNVLQMAGLFETGLIGVFAGRDPEKPISDNIPMFREVWSPLAEEAERLGVRIAFENCTMFRGYPIRGINIAHTPAAYQLMFEVVQSPALGIEFDPSHLLKQLIDPVGFLRHIPGKIFHVHAKDHERLETQQEWHGCFDMRASRDRFPGRGEIDFPGIFEELRHQDYQGDVTIEGERDPDADTDEEIEAGLGESVKFLRGLI